MKDESLGTLLRLRRIAADEARRNLADCLRQESAARQALRDLEAAVECQMEAAARVDASDRAVEEFAAWLRRNRIEKETNEQALHLAETRSAEARSVLSVSMIAVETLEKLLDRRAEAREAGRDRQDRNDLDELGNRR